MHHWDRDILGTLQRIITPVEQGCEISVHSDQMDPLSEEQQSQGGTPVNPTAYRSMREHIIYTLLELVLLPSSYLMLRM